MSRNKFGKSEGFQTTSLGIDSETQNDSLTQRPLSLTAGVTLSWLNVLGQREAKVIVNEWKPRFTIRYATAAEMEEMSW